MRYLYIVIFFVFYQSYSQNKLSEIDKLAGTAKVWGFLKYYHPNVASGQFDWDNELYGILSKVEYAQTKEEFSKIIENWISSLGEIKKCNSCYSDKNTSKYFYKNIDLLWIKNNKLFSTSLSKKLEFITQNNFQGKQFYVDQREGDNVFLINENYSNFNWSVKNQRLLALFRYWNVIEYFFPYKYLMDQKWDLSLQEALIDFLAVQKEEDFQLAMLKLVVHLNDSHATFYYKTPSNVGKPRKFLPFKSVIIDNKIVITEILSDSLAKMDDIKIGDVIVSINGQGIKKIIERKKKYVHGSNEAAYFKNLIFDVTTGWADSINLKIIRDNKEIDKSIFWKEYNLSHSNEFKKEKKIERYRILKENVGYVDMGKLRIKDVRPMMESLFDTKAIIFDIRNYPKSTNYEISKYLNSHEIPFAKYTYPDLTYPGRFIWSEPDTCGSDNPNNYKGKVIVLVNEYSISQSEWTTMSLKTAPNATVIGSQTAGADGSVSHIDFVKNYEAPFSGLGVYYPDGKETQRIGIIPDIEVKPTIIGIKQGKDEVLERALEFIESDK